MILTNIYKEKKRKMILNEIFSYKIGTIQTKNGNNLRVAYIDPKESENTFNVKDKLKSYGAHWHNTAKWWYWPLGKNPEYVIQNQVRPCIEELSVIEDGGNSTRKVANIVDELIKKGCIKENDTDEYLEWQIRVMKD